MTAAINPLELFQISYNIPKYENYQLTHRLFKDYLAFLGRDSPFVYQLYCFALCYSELKNL